LGVGVRPGSLGSICASEQFLLSPSVANLGPGQLLVVILQISSLLLNAVCVGTDSWLLAVTQGVLSASATSSGQGATTASDVLSDATEFFVSFNFVVQASAIHFKVHCKVL
jgi:hypothetical protein